MKRESKKKKTKSQLTVVKSRKIIEDTDDEKPFDSGGLPERDLKKGLGCG